MPSALIHSRSRILIALILIALALFGVWAVFLRPRVLHTAQPVNVAIFSPDGKMLATGHTAYVKDEYGYWAYGSGEIQLRRLQSGLVTRTFPFFDRSVERSDDGKNGGPVGWLAFSPNGKLLMASNQNGGNDDTVGVLNIASGRWLLSLRGTENEKAHICYRPIGFSPDSRHAFVLQFAADSILALQKPDATREQVSQIKRDSRLIVYDCATGAVVQRFPHVLEPGEWPAQATVLSDGVTVAMTTYLGNATNIWANIGSLVLFDIRTGKRLRTVQTGHQSTRLSAAATAPYLAQASSDGKLDLWTDPTVPPYTDVPVHADNVWNVALTPDGRTMASSGPDNHLYLWSIRRHVRARILSFNTPWVSSLAFSPDSKLLAQTGPGNAVNLWRVW